MQRFISVSYEKKDASTINDNVYHELDEKIDTISDTNKQVDPRIDPMAETHIVNRVRKLSVLVGLYELAVIGGGIGPVTNALENSRMELSLNSLSLLNTNTSKAFVIG